MYYIVGSAQARRVITSALLHIGTAQEIPSESIRRYQLNGFLKNIIQALVLTRAGGYRRFPECPAPGIIQEFEEHICGSRKTQSFHSATALQATIVLVHTNDRKIIGHVG
jgi:hypothetical protein